MSEAIAMASREFTGPLREEMTRIYENQKIGIPLGEAALQTARRVPLTEVHMFATALQIQSETGSSLSEVLTNLSNVIRARYRLKRKVRALSSEAKSSAASIAALPVLVTLGLYAARPEYISILFVLPKGKVMLAGACVWMSFGVLMMRQMINFRV
jgi:tight adherence protein B